MYDLIVRLFKFLFPIARQAALEVAADTLSNAARYKACPARNHRRSFAMYNTYERTPDYSHRFEDDSYERNAKKSLREDILEAGGYHDVLMVAFDITALNKTDAHFWLADKLIDVVGDDYSRNVNVDSWWIADDSVDNSWSDCDSAVFVKKGCQKAARALLRSYGLTSN